jgi:nucleoside-triphosphatase THEP1
MASRPLFIVGERDGGKSTTLIRLLSELPWRAMRTCGVLALANVGKTQYTLKDLGSKETRLALSCEPHDGWKRLGKFSYDEDAFNWANKRIIRSLPQAELAVFDEIGRLEMEGVPRRLPRHWDEMGCSWPRWYAPPLSRRSRSASASRRLM